MRHLFRILVILVLGTVATASAQTPSPTQGDAQRGKQAWGVNLRCMNCHGAAGEGGFGEDGEIGRAAITAKGVGGHAVEDGCQFVEAFFEFLHAGFEIGDFGFSETRFQPLVKADETGENHPRDSEAERPCNNFKR